MDEMRTNWILATAVVAITVTAAVGAQSASTMQQPAKGNTMSMTYTGCVESVNQGAAFLLTRVDGASSESMHGDMAMKHDDMAMKRDDMAMKGDAAKTMPHEQMPMAGETMAPMSKSLALTGSNLGKHVGQKVSVTGSLSDGSMGAMHQDMSTLTVKTLKVIAKSCS
jgi:hypothetical protein